MPAPTFEQRSALMRQLWDRMDFDPGQKPACMAKARKVLAGKAQYLKVQSATGVPWFWVGIAHMMEGDCDFTTHLHNGDSLKARTKQVPAGRPPNGNPPFDWYVSAIDAVTMPGKRYQLIANWSIERCLYQWEAYNGFGYVRTDNYTPYLWARTNINDGTGKYVADGHYNPGANADGQCGAAAILKCLMEIDDSVKFGVRAPRPVETAGGAIVGGTTAVVTAAKSAGYDWTTIGAAAALVVLFCVIAAIAYKATRK